MTDCLLNVWGHGEASSQQYWATELSLFMGALTVYNKLHLQNTTRLISRGIHINKGNVFPLQGDGWADQNEEAQRHIYI